MIYIQDKDLKIAGKNLPGQVRSVSITEEGILKNKKNKKNKSTKANVPSGYDAATVTVQMLFEESDTYDRNGMVLYVQKLFKKSGQKKQKLMRIVEKQVNARGISEVYFNGFETTGEIGQSWYTGTLTLVAPKYAGIKVVKTKAAAAKAKAKKKKKSGKKNKSKKKTGRSPAKDTRSTNAAKRKAKKVVKRRKK